MTVPFFVFGAANDMGGWGIVPMEQIDLSEWSNLLISPV
jgi:hypothetical protein